MGDVRPHQPALLLLAAFSRHTAALEWARQTTEAAWGPIALASPAFDFAETSYYQPTMGEHLQKQFFVYERLVDPAMLVDFKLQSNKWETEYASLARHDEPRPLNLDPGYITLAKLVLASTKDHAHRLCLGRGIYAEFTLQFRAGNWRPCEWTYPDYRRDDFQAFFSECRSYLKARSS